jgi:hypothetical protein
MDGSVSSTLPIEYALETFGNIAKSNDAQVRLGSRDLGLVELLISVVVNKSGQVSASSREYALGALGDIALHFDNKAYMGSQDLGLVELLMSVIKNRDDGETTLAETEKAITVLVNIAKLVENRERLGSRDLGLVELLILVAKNENGKSTMLARDGALRALMSTAACADNNIRMTSRELGLLELLVSLMENKDATMASLLGREYTINALGNLAFFTVDIGAISRFVELNIHQLFLRIVEQAENAGSAWGILENAAFRSLVYLSQHVEICNSMKSIGLLTTASSIHLQGRGHDASAVLKAKIIIIFIEGRDEYEELFTSEDTSAHSFMKSSASSTNIIQSNPIIITDLVKEYCDTINNAFDDHEPIAIRFLLKAILMLAISDSNKIHLMQAGIMAVLAKSLKMFLVNEIQVVISNNLIRVD